jgi:hypothetical protein
VGDGSDPPKREAASANVVIFRTVEVDPDLRLELTTLKDTWGGFFVKVPLTLHFCAPLTLGSDGKGFDADFSFSNVFLAKAPFPDPLCVFGSYCVDRTLVMVQLVKYDFVHASSKA